MTQPLSGKAKLPLNSKEQVEQRTSEKRSEESEPIQGPSPSMSKPPVIQPRSSLLPPDFRTELNKIAQRKISRSSTYSQDSSVSEFLDQKIADIDNELDYVEMTRAGLQKVLQEYTPDKEDIVSALKELEHEGESWKKEMIIIKRQRKLIEDDMEEEGVHKTVEEAYARSMMNRVLAATGKATKAKFDQTGFRKSVLEYYNALDEETSFVHCPLTGWCHPKDVKAAHLVPKSFQSEEIAYLFGAGEIALTDPRNGLMLQNNIGQAFDKARVAIVPIPTKRDEATKWKLLLADNNLKDLEAFRDQRGITRWKDLDGKELIFLNEKRPARRYLYFRYIMTYMAQKKAGSTDWSSKAESKNAMWATPGPYLRKSMLLALARQVSHQYLPEVLIEQRTFDKVPGSSPRSADEEKTLGMSLGLLVKEHQDREKRPRENDEDSSEDSDFTDNE